MKQADNFNPGEPEDRPWEFTRKHKVQQANRTRVAKVNPHQVREGCQIQIVKVKTARSFQHQTCLFPVRVTQAKMTMCEMLRIFQHEHIQSNARVNK